MGVVTGGAVSSPKAHEAISGLIPGGQVNISNGDTQQLPWRHSDYDTLLDYTDPLNPSVIHSGMYAFYAEARSDDVMTVGGDFFSSLILDPAGDQAEADALSPQASSLVTNPRTIMNMVWYLAAGAIVQMWVENDDGAASRHFRLAGAFIQQIG